MNPSPAFSHLPLACDGERPFLLRVGWNKHTQARQQHLERGKLEGLPFVALKGQPRGSASLLYMLGGTKDADIGAWIVPAHAAKEAQKVMDDHMEQYARSRRNRMAD
jgi:hypothetical protein